MFPNRILRRFARNLHRWQGQFLSRPHAEGGGLGTTPKAQGEAAPEQRCVSLADLDGKLGTLAGTATKQCHQLHEFVLSNPISQILELGFHHGKSAAYMAGGLAAKGGGLVTTIDVRGARSYTPSIIEVGAMTALAPYIKPIFSDVGSAWEMRRMIVDNSDQAGHCSPVFDFCFIDAFHSWEMAGIDFFLADKLLKPGSWLLFDDLVWSFETSPSWGKLPATKAMAPEYRSAHQVGDVFRYLVMQHPGYENFRIENNNTWGWARKKL